MDPGAASAVTILRTIAAARPVAAAGPGAGEGA
jgi:hypothetical protein